MKNHEFILRVAVPEDCENVPLTIDRLLETIRDNAEDTGMQDCAFEIVAKEQVMKVSGA